MARTKAAAKKRGAKVVAGSAASNFAFSIGEAGGRALRPLLPLLVLGVIYAGATYLLWLPVRDDPLVTLKRERLMGPDVLPSRQEHPWISNPEWQQIKQRGLVAVGHSVFEPDLSKKIANSYEGSPWVKEVGRVRLGYPASLQVSNVVYRKPFATVQVGNHALVIDKEGFVLPVAVNRTRVRLPWISGLAVPATMPGNKLEPLQVEEALSLMANVAETLRNASTKCKVAGVRLDGSLWRVMLENGPILEWGYWDETLRPEGEPGTREKKAALIRRLSEWDPSKLKIIRLDMPNAPVEPKN